MTQNQQSQSRIKKYICFLSALHARTLANTWHLLSGSDVLRASHTFYLHTLMLIIKYRRLKSFLRKAEENGFTLICMLKTEMRQHSMKNSIITMVTKAGRRAVCFSPATSLWGHSTDPTAPAGIRALFSFLASHKQVLYLSEKPQ